MEKMMEWINVNDRLPEPDIDVLVYIINKHCDGTDYESIEVSSYVTEYGRDCVSFEWVGKITCNDKVTHWMPLPNPPEE